MNQSNGAFNGDNIGECQRLRETVAYLEKARAEDRQQVERLKAERDAYLQAIYRWSRSQVSEEQLQRWANETPNGDSFDRVLEVLGMKQEPRS